MLALKLHLLEDTGSKHSSQVKGSHTIVRLVALNQGEELAEVAEEAVVNIWKLLEQVSRVAIVAAVILCRHATGCQDRSHVRVTDAQSVKLRLRPKRDPTVFSQTVSVRTDNLRTVLFRCEALIDF